MKIYFYENGFNRKVLDKLKEIQSNESGKIIDFNLLDTVSIDYFLDFPKDEKVILLSNTSDNIVKSFLNNYNEKEPCLIIFDSRIELDKRKYLKDFISRGFKNILFVGTRNLKREELIFLRENKINFISMNQLLEFLEDTCDTIMEFSYGKNLYLLIDFSVLDPIFVLSNKEDVGGLTSREFFYLIQRISKMKNLTSIELITNNLKEEGLPISIVSKTISEVI